MVKAANGKEKVKAREKAKIKVSQKENGGVKEIQKVTPQKEVALGDGKEVENTENHGVNMEDHQDHGRLERLHKKEMDLPGAQTHPEPERHHQDNSTDQYARILKQENA